jgi:hypothetical protein
MLICRILRHLSAGGEQIQAGPSSWSAQRSNWVAGRALDRALVAREAAPGRRARRGGPHVIRGGVGAVVKVAAQDLGSGLRVQP